MSRDGDGAASDEGLDGAAAETRVVDAGDPDATRVATADEQAAPTRVVPDAAATGLPDGEAETVLAPDASLAHDDDRTQLVTRASAGEEGDASPETRVLDPDRAPSDGARRPVDTRVLDEPDKTAPPPVVPVGPSRAAPPAPEPDRGLAPGTTLFGEYEIVNVLGVGGMGEVYRARHRRLDEHRAIKVMHAELSKKKGASEFFYREAKALLAVRHPAVVHCHDLLSDDQGRVYLIMEMIEGIPLSKRMNEGPLGPDEVALLGARVSHGLAAAHRRGVIHRDLSPDNIVLPGGRIQEAKIIDFGIAKLLEEGEGTIVDGFKGKLSYASPEQLGFHGGKVDGRSDFYSLGLVLAAAALGRPMSMGTTVVEAVDARRAFRTLPDAIPMGLRSAIEPLLALDPDDRPRYVDRLFVVPGGVEGATDSMPMPSADASRGPGPARASRTPTITAVAGVTALALAGVAWWALSSVDGTGPTPTMDAPIAIEPTPGAADADRAPVEVVAPAAEVARVVPEAPRRPSARERARIRGYLGNARLALRENRLMSPAGDNAYDRYRKVLELDPRNADAKDGLREIATRYVSFAESALDGGDVAQARDYLDRARQADASYAGIARLAARLR